MKRIRRSKKWSVTAIMFLKQVRIGKMILTVGIAAFISSFWYVKRFGEPISSVYGFTGLDSLFFFCGNYPKEMETGLIPDHYLMAMLPFIILAEHLISYVDTNICERIFYICLRRKKLWRQAVHDFRRIGFIVFGWMICYQALLEMILSCLYGGSGVSYFLNNTLTAGQGFGLAFVFALRQSIILVSISVIGYVVQLWAGSVWAAIVMIGSTAAMLLTVFSGTKIPIMLNLCSFQMAEPMILLALILAGIVFLRKYFLKIYLHV